ncbi:MAG: recombinase family protein [Tissierellales bacterium]|jgi:rubrerythrin|nr:recombinase family protein [Tissierellales bacterium]
MQTGFVYAFGDSISKQIGQIEEYARAHDIKLVNRYFDGKDLSSKRKFNKMVRDALNFPPNFIITLKSRNISEDIKTLEAFEQNMKSYGIELIYLNEPVKDKIPSIVLEVGDKKMSETSTKIEENEMIFPTHHAPYGYIAEKLDTRKYKWKVVEEEKKIIRKILIGLYTDKGYSYQDIKDWLNEKNIETRRGKAWTTSSVVNILKKERLETYFNFENRLSIISKKEYDKILQRKAYNSAISIFGRTKNSSYVLTGINVRLEPIFRCKHCGGNVIGYKNSSKTWSNYVCGNYRTKGLDGCENDWYLKQDRIEDALWQVINRAYMSDERKLDYRREIIEAYELNSLAFTKGMRVLLKNLLERKIRFKDVIEAARDSEVAEQREIVRLFVDYAEMNSKTEMVHVKLFGVKEIKIQF